MKQFLKSKMVILTCILLVAVASIYATQRVRPWLSSNGGGYIKFGGTAADTCIMADTLTYPFYVEHTNVLVPYVQYTWQKVSSGNPSVTVKIQESLDGITYFDVKRPADRSYTKAISPTATTSYNINFDRDTCVLQGRWVRVSFITTNSPSSGVKGKISGQIKFNNQ